MVRRRSGVRFPSPAPLRSLAKPGRKTKSPCAITPTTMTELQNVFLIGHEASADTLRNAALRPVCVAADVLSRGAALATEYSHKKDQEGERPDGQPHSPKSVLPHVTRVRAADVGPCAHALSIPD